MTTRNFCIKWGIYTLALLPVWFLEFYVLNRLPLYGIRPMLMPLAAVAVGVLEGPTAGAGYGLAVGILYDALLPGLPGGMTAGLSLLGSGAGFLIQYGLRPNLLGCLFCSALALGIMDALRVMQRWLLGIAAPTELLAVAGPELLWSLAFTLPIYGLYRWIHKRVPERGHF